MYTRRSELDSSFGPYEVSICDTNIKLGKKFLDSQSFPSLKKFTNQYSHILTSNRFHALILVIFS